jgi:hypothetical protein
MAKNAIHMEFTHQIADASPESCATSVNDMIATVMFMMPRSQSPMIRGGANMRRKYANKLGVYPVSSALFRANPYAR